MLRQRPFRPQLRQLGYMGFLPTNRFLCGSDRSESTKGSRLLVNASFLTGVQGHEIEVLPLFFSEERFLLSWHNTRRTCMNGVRGSRDFS